MTARVTYGPDTEKKLKQFISETIFENIKSDTNENLHPYSEKREREKNNRLQHSTRNVCIPGIYKRNNKLV